MKDKKQEGGEWFDSQKTSVYRIPEAGDKAVYGQDRPDIHKGGKRNEVKISPIRQGTGRDINKPL